MQNIPRLVIEQWEEEYLAPYAAKAGRAGRRRDEEPCPFRTAFQRDRDRVAHSKAFRRLAHKTQVFFNPTGDHYRTRLTHTLEVSQIARTLARSLRLNEDLTEAAALGHDLGHTPFGHSGERVLARLRGEKGFSHQAQSLRVVEVLAKDGRGLNLTDEVRDGIAKHSKGQGPVFVIGEKAPKTYEGFLVRIADLVAYLAHDLDDALRSGLLSPGETPAALSGVFGLKPSTVIGAMVGDLLRHTKADGRVLHLGFSPAMEKSMAALRNFLYTKVYANPRLLAIMNRSDKIVAELYGFFRNDPAAFLEIYPQAAGFELEEAICDFISGMTDRYALDLYQHLFWPHPWPGHVPPSPAGPELRPRLYEFS